jgi:hypothetical protein
MVVAMSDRTTTLTAATEEVPDFWGSPDGPVDSAVEPVEAEADMQRGDDLTVLTFAPLGDSPVQHVPRRWVGVAAAAVTILAVAGLLVVADRDSGENVAAPAVSSSAADPVASSVAEPYVVPDVAVGGWESRWSRVPHSEAAFGDGFEQVMSSVTVGGPGLVAVGQAGGAVPKAAVWTSPEGITWSRVPGHEAIFDDAAMRAVTAGGPGLVAVGDSADDAAVWTSSDGITWSRVPHSEAVFGDAGMNGVTAGGPGLVAVGDQGGSAGVWTSLDGIIWSRAPQEEAIFKGEGTRMKSVTVGGPGLVAVGEDGPLQDDTDAAVWTSPDGITWSRTPHTEAVFGDAGMNSVTAFGPGLVAVGGYWRPGLQDGRFGALVWTSFDGITWSRVAHDEDIFEGDEAGMESVTVADHGLVAVGSHWHPQGVEAAAWTSVDGFAWSRVPHDEAVFGAQPRPVLEMNSVTAGGPGLVAVGANHVHDTSGATESDAAVWVATFDGCSDGGCSDDVTGDAS